VLNAIAFATFQNANPRELKAWHCATTMPNILDGKNTG